MRVQVKPGEKGKSARKRQRAAEAGALGTQRKQAGEALIKSEREYRTIIEPSKAVIFSKDRDGCYHNPNLNAALGLGVTRIEDVEGKTAHDFFPKEQADAIRVMDKRVMESGKLMEIEEVLRDPQGKDRMYLSYKWPKHDGKGRITGINCFGNDITELKLAQEKQQAIVKTALDGFWIVNSESGLLEVNESYCKMIGYTREELLKMSIQDIEAVEKPEDTARRVKRVMRRGSDHFETRHKRKDGKIIDVEVNINYLDMEGGQIFVFLHDITERKQVKDRLWKSEERFRALTENTSDWVWEVDANGVYTYANPRVKELLGYEPEEVIGKTPFDFMPTEEAERIAREFQAAVEAYKPLVRLENANLHKDGRLVILETSGRPIFDSSGQLAGYRGIDRDITERKQAEDELRESERRYRLLAENAGDVIWTVDMNMRPTYMSPSVTRLLGYSVEEAMAKPMEAVYAPASYEIAMKVLAEELAIENMEQKDLSRSRTLELELKHKDGSIVPVEVGYSFLRDADVQPTGILAIARDITARKRQESKIEHLNQLLHAIFNVSEFVSKETDPDRLIKGVCDTLIKARCYHHAWVTLLDKSASLVVSAESGLGKDFLPVVEEWKLGRLPACAERTLSHSDVAVTRDTASSCTDCSLADKYGSGSALSVRLEHEGRVYGMLSICATSLYSEGEEELSLLLRIAGDIAFALHSIELEEQRRRAVDDLVELTNLL